jgi:ABC-type glycerol-3-phosphate transport system permease component
MAINHRFSRFFGDFLVYGLLITISAFMILPFIWMLTTSLKNADEIFHLPPIIISPNMDLHAYIYLIKEYNLLGVLRNSFVIAALSTLLQLIFCSLGGYAFAKFKFPGKNALFAFLLGTMIIPFTIIMVPLFFIMRDFNWVNKFQAIIIPTAANAFGIFFMRQYISSVEDELMDAARIDGCGEFGIYSRIILPIITPGLVSLGLIFFMSSWNSFLWPLIILKTQENFTLPLVIRSMVGPVGRTVYDVQMAASIISIIPLLIIFLVFQRRFVEGITAGAVKG